MDQMPINSAKFGRRFAAISAFAVGMVPCMIAPAPASAATRLISAYSISFLGFGIGKMTNSIQLSGNNYKISGAVRANSMIALVSKTRANFQSDGRIEGTRVVPTSHSYSFATSRKKGTLAMNFNGGDVKKVSANPVVKYKPGSVPVEKSHLDNVMDPLSSLIIAVQDKDIGDGRKICNRTMPMFDGKTRINLAFSYKSKKFDRAKGFKGETFTCSVRYQPVSGIRPFKKNVKFMAANRDMEVTFARIGKTSLYTLFAFKVRTTKGTAAGKAYKFISQ